MSGADIVPAFICTARVYWEDTDAGGVVYHANYLKFLERARSEWLRALGVAQQTLRDTEDCVFVVHAMQIEFRAPARLDDLLDIRAQVVRVGGASLEFMQDIRRAGQVLLTAKVEAASVSASAFRLRAMPAWLRQRIKSNIAEGHR